MKAETHKLFRSIRLRIALPAMATVVLFVCATFLFIVPSLERVLLEKHLEASRFLVESATSIVGFHHSRWQAGEVSEATAKQDALKELRKLRYGDDEIGYYWVLDDDVTMVMHPYRPDLEGTDLSGITDPTGVVLFSEMVEVALRQIEGEVRYQWQWKDDEDRILEKSAWVRYFEPWHWIVGTGIYVDQVEADIASLKRESLTIMAVVSLGALLMAGLVVSQARRVASERQRIWSEREALVGQLEHQREQYRSLVDNIASGVIRVDRDLNVMAANATFKQWFPEIVPDSGYRSLEVFGLGPDDPVPDDCPARLTLADGAVHEAHHEIMVHGQTRHMRIVSSPVTGSDGVVRFVILVLDDFTDHLARDRELEEAEAKYRGLFEHSVEGIYQTSVSGDLLSANPALVQIFGFDTADEFMEYINRYPREVYVEPTRREEFLEILKQDGIVNDFESEVYTRAGKTIWIKENARAVVDESGRITHINGVLLDISKRKEAEAALAKQQVLFQELFESSPLGIALVDEKGNTLKVNHGFEALFGYKAEEVIGHRPRQLVVPDVKIAESESLVQAIERGKSVTKETIRQHADGSIIPVQLVGYPIKINEKFAGAYFLYQDITERKSFEKQLSHQAFHDALTALPNRTLYMERLSRAVQRGRRREEYNFAVMMIDLNRFKRVNDTLGHLAGDELLVGVALRILSCIRTVDTVARLGGDEFAILLEEFETSREVIQVSNRIRDKLAEPFIINGHEVLSGGAIGIVLETPAYDSAEEILRDADIAMYQCKERGKDRLVFSKRMHDAVVEVGQLEDELRVAVLENQMELHYQPIIHVVSGELQGFEALVRWHHPTRGLLQPMEFIPLAEETGLIIPMGRWVISEACKQMASWCDHEDDRCAAGVSMSVNISARQFAQPDLVEFIKGELEKNSMNASRLKLEITETVLMDEAKQARYKLDRLKELGVQIMVDDFGTGYSSLSYLQQFPVDYLKIDKSFISGEGSEADNREIVNTIIMLARNMGLKVVAEGVEEQSHLDMLRELNCDNAQGFMFSKPVDKTAATDILQEFLMILRDRKA